MTKTHISLAILAALSLTACGSDSDDTNPPIEEPVNVAPQAVADSAEVESGSSDSIDVLANDTDEDGDTLEITDVSEPENGTAEIADGAITYTPNEGFLGDDSFTYTISDGEETAQADVTVTVVDTVTVVGLITDEPIPFADISLTVDGETFEVQADENGRYELPVKIKNLEGDQVIRMTARGTEEGQTHVRLNSLLMSSTDLIETAGTDGELTRDEFNDVNVTHVTTARDVLIRKAAENETLTTENIDIFGNAIDPDLLIQMAAVVKLLTDDPETFALPEGVEDVESFIENEEQYNSFVEEVSQVPEGAEHSPLQAAIEETLADPAVMPELSMSDLLGRYAEIGNTAPFFLPSGSILREFTAEGVKYYSVDDKGQRVSVSLNGNRLLTGENNIYEESVGYYTITASDFDFDSAEAEQAWLDTEANPSALYPIENRSRLIAIDVISRTEHKMVVKETIQRELDGYQFEYQGTTYTAIEPSVTELERVIRLVELDSLKQNELVFDLTANDTWYLPLLTPTWGPNISEGGLYQFNPDGTWALTIHPQYSHATDAIDDALLNGTWQLSEDQRTLTLSSAADQFGAKFTRYRSEQEAQGVIYEAIENQQLTGLAQIKAGVPVDFDALDFSLLDGGIGEDKILTSTVNWKAPLYWDGDQLRPANWFMFEFNSDGTGNNVGSTLCDGQPIEFAEICQGKFEINPDFISPLSWEVTSHDGLEQGFVIDRAPNSDVYENIRVWLPLSKSERDIVSLIEWNAFDYEPGTQNEVYFVIKPRYNMYIITDKPAVADSESTALPKQMQQQSDSVLLNLNPLSGYNVVYSEEAQAQSQSLQ